MKKVQFFKKEITYGSAEEKLLALIKLREPKEIEHVIKTADDVCNHEFLFDMEWDMERTYEPVTFGETIDWRYNPGEDPEFTWQFNRHRFLICLGQAYQLTGEERYATCLIDLLLQFIRTEQKGADNRMSTWRILEVGIRSGNWIKALYLIQNSKALTEDILEEIYASMKIHAQTIMEEHSPYCYAGNWGVLENHGLFLLGAMLPQIEETIAYRKQAVSVLDAALQMQIMPDGMQLEQSPMYHNEILRCMLEVLWLAAETNLELPERMRQTVYQMAKVSKNFLKPNGHQFTMGDSDDMDMRPVMEMAACVYQDGSFKQMGNLKISYEVLWLMGEKGEHIYEKLEPVVSETASACMYDSGHTFLRTSWEKTADVFHFDAGLLGTSHGHSDALHVDWIVEGEDVLIDPGRYTYVNQPERYEFKETGAHNTIQIDGKNFCLWENSWVSKTVMAQTRQNLVERGGMQYTQGSHTGYMTLDEPVLVTRKIIHLSPDIYVIADECYTNGEHSYRQLFHFDSRGKVKQEENRVVFTNGEVKASVFPDAEGETNLYKTRQSYHYNQCEPNVSMACMKQGTGFQSFCTVCVKGDGSHTSVERLPVRSSNTQRVIPRELAEGIRIRHNQKTYLLIIGHTEMPAPVDLYQIEECVGCGNVIVFEPEKGSLSGIVLNW